MDGKSEFRGTLINNSKVALSLVVDWRYLQYMPGVRAVPPSRLRPLTDNEAKLNALFSELKIERGSKFT